MQLKRQIHCKLCQVFEIWPRQCFCFLHNFSLLAPCEIVPGQRAVLKTTLDLSSLILNFKSVHFYQSEQKGAKGD